MPIGSNGLQSTAEGQGHDEILVVDDLAADLLAITAILEPLGVRVLTVQSGEAALRLLLKREFKLLILDVNMPTMSGFELARRIRDRDRSSRIPIIFITASAHEDRRVLDAYELGAVDFLFKPVAAPILRAKASMFIDLARRAELIRDHERREHARVLEMERKAWHEESLQREMEQLAEMHRRKDRFLAVLGHELRNPLTPLVASLELLRQKFGRTPDLDPMIARIRDIMERHVEHLTRLAEDLVDVARINSGKVELRKALVSIQDIVDQAVAMSRPGIEERKQSLELHVPVEPLVVDGDRVRLVQIVANLLNNAARYTPPKGRIDVHCERAENVVELRVVDNGYGISPKLIPHVFDAFVQGNERQSAGLGLGLAIVQRLTTLHGGTISVLSEGERRGTMFTVRLPLAEETRALQRDAPRDVRAEHGPSNPSSMVARPSG
jgi:signal transduction histidine kinase